MEHKIDGEVLLQLNDEHLKEIAPLLGDRLKVESYKQPRVSTCR